MTRLEAGEGLTPQLTLEAGALKEAVGTPITPLKKRLPFVYRLQRAILGQWEEIDDGQVLCPHCGSSLVAGKENTPRTKKYRHSFGRLRTGLRQENGVRSKGIATIASFALSFLRPCITSVFFTPCNGLNDW